jgi:hypothetical protein
MDQFRSSPLPLVSLPRLKAVWGGTTILCNLNFANLYSYKADHLDVLVTDLNFLEDFMLGVVSSVEGTKGDDYYLNQ